MKIISNILKDKILIILLSFFIGFAIFDLVSRSSFNVNIFYFTPLATLSLAYFFSSGERVFKIIILILFFGISFLYVQGSLSIYTCRYNSDYHCLAKRAIKNQNPSLCDMAKDDGILDESSRAWCYRDLSKNWKDASICENVKTGDVSRYFGNYYRCITNIAINTNNPSLCEKIEYDKKFSPNKKECYIKLGQDPPAAQSTFVFTNDFHGMTFQVPDGYIIGGNQYGVDDPVKAKSFFFRKKSDNYIGVPTLNADDNLKLPTDQTFDQFINSIYEVNKEEGNASTNLKKSEYGGVSAYEFGINHSYANPNGGQLLDSLGGKVVFIYKDQKILEFLQTGHEPNLSDILKSIKFK